MDEVTRGDVWSLHDLVKEYGRALVTRVLADGFGIVLLLPEWSNDAIHEAIIECRFLPLDESLALVAKPVIPDEYFGHGAPGALDFQTDWRVLRPYASDDPKAVAEVPRLHAE